jgi:hypothetical protein
MLDVLVDNHISYFAQLAREDFLELRQEANELQEYSNAKLDRVTRYLGVLAEKTRKLGKGCFLHFGCMVLVKKLRGCYFPRVQGLGISFDICGVDGARLFF